MIHPYFLLVGSAVVVGRTYVGNVSPMYVPHFSWSLICTNTLPRQKRYSATYCQRLTESFDHRFYPLTRFSETELQDVLSDVEKSSVAAIDVDPYPLPDDIVNMVADRKVLKFPYEFPEQSFERLWSYGIPLVIMGVGTKLQLPWSPKYFSDTYGHKRCTVEDTSTGKERKTSVAEFFELFDKCSDELGSVEKIKVCKSQYYSLQY